MRGAIQTIILDIDAQIVMLDILFLTLGLKKKRNVLLSKLKKRKTLQKALPRL